MPNREYGERDACARCGQDIEWQGPAYGWRDRGGNRLCVAWYGRNGDLQRPPRGAKHRYYPMKAKFADRKIRAGQKTHASNL